MIIIISFLQKNLTPGCRAILPGARSTQISRHGSPHLAIPALGILQKKFAEAAQAGALPIYWGDPEIGNYFNSKAFINCHGYPTLDEAVSRVIEIDQDEVLYRQMLAEPWFPNNTKPKILSEDSIKSFLKNIFDQPLEEAYRRNRSRWGMKYEKSLHRIYFHPLKQYGHEVRAWFRGKA
jgi:hypothetical protein